MGRLSVPWSVRLLIQIFSGQRLSCGHRSEKFCSGMVANRNLILGGVLCLFSRDFQGLRGEPKNSPLSSRLKCQHHGLSGRFPALMGRFSILMGRFPDFVEAIPSFTLCLYCQVGTRVATLAILSPERPRDSTCQPPA